VTTKREISGNRSTAIICSDDPAVIPCRWHPTRPLDMKGPPATTSAMETEPGPVLTRDVIGKMSQESCWPCHRVALIA